MTTISVKAINSQHFQVTVVAKNTTIHEVSVSLDYAKQLGTQQRTTAALVEQSFVFLLARESNTSILRRFDLSVISHYFSDCESAIRKA